MKSKALSFVLAGIFALTLFAISSSSALANYPHAHGGYNHANHVHLSPGRVSFGRGGVGISFGNSYASNRFRYQPNYWGPQYRQNYVTPRLPYVPNLYFGNPLIVPRYNYGTYRQFYIDPSNYQRNSAPSVYPAPYGTGVDRYEFQRFQQETRDQLQQLSEQQRRSNVEQQQLERGQQQLELGQRRLQQEQKDLERELQDIQNLLRK